MKYKIITTACKTCKNMLLYVDINEEGDYCAHLVAWHEDTDGEQLQEEIISFGKSLEMAKSFISDYSIDSATAFCNSNEF